MPISPEYSELLGHRLLAFPHQFREESNSENGAREESKETVHIYVTPEQQEAVVESVPTVAVLPLLLRGVVAVLVAIYVLMSATSLFFPKYSIEEPLSFFSVQLHTTVTISPTGKQVMPAVAAHGTLTLYNGSILSEQLPTGFILSSSSGIEIVTEQAVTVQGSNPPNFGIAIVPAHAVAAGVSGNLPALAVIGHVGDALTIKNLAPFTGGEDARTTTYATDDDKATALSQAHATLKEQTSQYPALQPSCSETSTQADLALTVTWLCRLGTYRVPSGLHVESVQRQGDMVRLEVSQ